MSKLIWILLIGGIAVVILLILIFIYVCFKIEDLEEKEFNFYDDDIDEK